MNTNFKLNKTNSMHKLWFAAFIAVTGGGLLIAYPSVMISGVKYGLMLCVCSVVPSLFPFMVVSNFLINSGAHTLLGKILGGSTRKIFKLPAVAGSVIIMGLTGGFPVGASMTARLVDSGQLTCAQAKRLMLFCINAGPAFVIGSVGTSMLSSKRAGLILYASLALGSIVMGYFSRFITAWEDDITQKHTLVYEKNPLSSSFTKSVADAASSIAGICSWVILFSCILEFISFLLKNQSLSIFIGSVLEVTTASEILAKAGATLPLFALVIGWGGLSVHCQVLSDAKKTGIPMSVFFASRVLNASVSAVICAALIKIFPCEISVLAAGAQPIFKAVSISGPVCAGLMLMSAILILDLDRSKKI